MSKSICTDALALLVGVALLLWAGTEVMAAQPLCASQGFSDCDSQTAGNQPCMVCLPGNCADTDPNTNCGQQPVGQHPVYGPYSVCACPGEGEPTCCHLIWRTTPGANPTFVSAGNCQAQETACPPGNKCSTRGTGGMADPVVHECEMEP